VPEQLPLQFEFQSNQKFNTFYPADNQEVITHLKNILINDDLLTFLWGEPATGKTHLLQATSLESSALDQSTFYFSLNKLTLPSADMLNGLESFDLVCFDNIEQISGNDEWEQAFFNFFNCHRDANKRLLLSASCPPKFLDMQLPDLKTRMAWGLTLKLAPLNEQQQLQALIYKAHELGFEVPLNVGRFLMTHYARDLPSIWSLLQQIEQATLAAQRKLTIPFLKQIMSTSDNQ